MKKKILVLSTLAASVIATLSMYLNLTNPCNDVLSTGVPKPQCEALVDLYESTNAYMTWSNNTNWMNFDVPIDEWHGVVVEDFNVVELTLWQNTLVGQIPESIGNLTSLRRLYLDHNHLSGQIPESIGNLTSLEGLTLNHNQLTGQIPASIGNLTSLEGLRLNDNQLTGQIPESIGNLTSLWWELYLYNNQLSGQIPESIGNITGLKKLVLYNNQLTGQIPESIGDLTSLESLHLRNNQLTGQIPGSIGNLASLEWLNLGQNQLSGQIPESIGDLTSLEYLILRDNQLTGQIPGSIGNLTSLEILYLSNNQLSGQIPESIGNLASLETLRLNHNYLSGDLPVSIISGFNESNDENGSGNVDYNDYLLLTSHGNMTLQQNCLNDLTSDHVAALSNNSYFSWISENTTFPDPFTFYEQGDAEYCTPEVEDGLVADMNGDGVVNIADLLLFLSTYNTNGAAGGDFNGDGVVGAGDLLVFLGQYGGEAPSSSGMPAFDARSGQRIIPDSIQDALASAGHPIRSKEEISKMEKKMEEQEQELMQKQEQELMQKLTEEEAVKEETQVKEEVYKTRR